VSVANTEPWADSAARTSTGATLKRFAFVSRELDPLGGGGIGVQVASACVALASVADVTIVTSSRLEPAYRKLREAGIAVLPPQVRVAFVDEPDADETGSYYGPHHLYSARVWDCLRELYPRRGPDLIEFSDFMAEGLVTIQARRAHDPILRDTTVCVRLQTSAEICSVLDGHLDDSFPTKMVVAAERYVLAHADRLISPTAAVTDTYTRYYGDPGALARVDELSPVVQCDARPQVDPPPGEDLRFLYLGRFERRKGPQQLVRAFSGLGRDGWRLTMVGGDTDTAPLGGSLRSTVDLATGGAPQIELLDELPRDRLAEKIDEAHVVVVPSLWECWPSVAMEALARNRPVLATPVGGLPAMLEGKGAGWLASGTGSDRIAAAVEALLAEPELVSTAIAEQGPLLAYRRLNDAGRFRDGYRTLSESPPGPAATPARKADLVSVVIPYFRLDGFIEDTVRSALEQDYEPIEVVVVNDGSWRPEDEVLERLADRFPLRIVNQGNYGLSRARNAGIVHSRGRYVLPLDADNILRPGFVSRCVGLLEAEPDAAFVTTWSQWIDEAGRPLRSPDQGIQPIGNHGRAVLEDNIAGDATALFRRELFDDGHRYCPDLASYEDWQLYRELHRHGHFGLVVPERLFVYRVRATSMVHEVGLPNHARIYAEMQAHLRAEEVRWEVDELTAPVLG
jgi:glycogen synthase